MIGTSHSSGGTSAPSVFKQELAHFPNDQRFVYDKHVVVRVMQFDDSRVFHPRPEALDRAFHPLREGFDATLEFLLLGRVQVPVVGHTELRGDFIKNAERRSLDTVVLGWL